MKSTGGSISIAASTQRLDVDNRISLRNYYRIANNLIKQADVYREEKSSIDLYVILLRFSSLITETIPNHKDFKCSLQRENLLFRKKLLDCLNELETLKPKVKYQVDELNRKSRDKANHWDKVPGTVEGSRFSPTPVQLDKPSQFKPIDYSKSSLSILRPKEETLSRHSILGPNGLHGKWQPFTVSQRIQYPTTLGLTPIEIPSLIQPSEDTSAASTESVLEQERSRFEDLLSLHDDKPCISTEKHHSLAIPDVALAPMKTEIPREPSPPPVLAEVLDLAVDTSKASIESLENGLVGSDSNLEVHISTTMMESFMRVARSNTDRNLETCGVLAGSLKNKKFFVTALIIPKQESTSDSCQTTNEEDIFGYQDKLSLFPLGWIHTHPTQSCFMSSIDVHTQYSYQIMLPEAIAIVMAPKDVSRKHGIFRLTTPGGMSVIRHCHQRGFHPHPEPSGGGPIYDHCTDVYLNPGINFSVVDLR